MTSTGEDIDGRALEAALDAQPNNSPVRYFLNPNGHLTEEAVRELMEAAIRAYLSALPVQGEVMSMDTLNAVSVLRRMAKIEQTEAEMVNEPLKAINLIRAKALTMGADALATPSRGERPAVLDEIAKGLEGVEPGQ